MADVVGAEHPTHAVMCVFGCEEAKREDAREYGRIVEGAPVVGDCHEATPRVAMQHRIQEACVLFRLNSAKIFKVRHLDFV